MKIIAATLLTIVISELRNTGPQPSESTFFLKDMPWIGFNIESCVSYVRSLILIDNLKLNDDKTEFPIICTAQQLEKVDMNFCQRGRLQDSSCAYCKESLFVGLLQAVHGKFVVLHFSICTTYDASGNFSLKSQLRLSFMPL